MGKSKKNNQEQEVQEQEIQEQEVQKKETNAQEFSSKPHASGLMYSKHVDIKLDFGIPEPKVNKVQVLNEEHPNIIING